MPRGGARPGSGRKKGAATRVTREVANKLVADGLTPLEVMLHAMRHEAEKQLQLKPDKRNWTAAAELACKAAPYMHPRLAAVEHGGQVGLNHTINEMMSELNGRTRGLPSDARGDRPQAH